MDMLTGESQIVSRVMMAHNPLETPTALFWDGFNAYCEGQPLAAMPTEQHEFGWWSASMTQAEMSAEELVEAREDEEFFRQGAW